MKIGRNKIYEWARRTGFGSLTGSMMPGEMRGLLPSPNSKEWSFVTGPIMCYGQGVAVTGLQIVNLYSAIANGGLLMEPRFVKSLTDMENKPICEYEPRVIRRIASEEIINTVRIMLEKVVMYGTGTLAKVEGYTVAGKTGTAQKLDTNIKKYTNKYISSFCGFIPSNNPELTILVVIDEPKKGYWASEIACPVFSNIAKDAMNYLEIQKKSIHNYAYNK
jgi:cell division protein FtsI/penicillin-binding protein 2